MYAYTYIDAGIPKTATVKHKDILISLSIEVAQNGFCRKLGSPPLDLSEARFVQLEEGEKPPHPAPRGSATMDQWTMSEDSGHETPCATQLNDF